MSLDTIIYVGTAIMITLALAVIVTVLVLYRKMKKNEDKFPHILTKTQEDAESNTRSEGAQAK